MPFRGIYFDALHGNVTAFRVYGARINTITLFSVDIRTTKRIQNIVLLPPRQGETNGGGAQVEEEEEKKKRQNEKHPNRIIISKYVRRLCNNDAQSNKPVLYGYGGRRARGRALSVILLPGVTRSSHTHTNTKKAGYIKFEIASFLVLPSPLLMPRPRLGLFAVPNTENFTDFSFLVHGCVARRILLLLLLCARCHCGIRLVRHIHHSPFSLFRLSVLPVWARETVFFPFTRNEIEKQLQLGLCVACEGVLESWTMAKWGCLPLPTVCECVRDFARFSWYQRAGVSVCVRRALYWHESDRLTQA